MKKAYEKPVIEIEEFEVEDIITASGLINGGAGTPDDINWGAIK